MRECYLDHSATTRVCRAAVSAAEKGMTEEYGNPSSLHTVGTRAQLAVEEARQVTAQFFGLSPSPKDRARIVFTGGGTEANNLAIFGLARAKKRQGNHVVVTALEHASALQACLALENEGFSVTVIHPDAHGEVLPETVAKACGKQTILVCMMAVNNETGQILPVVSVAREVRKAAPLAAIHCDAVQAAGKIPLFPIVQAVDTVGISGHKIGAPKGIGALYVREGVRLIPLFYGGGQERNYRSGTENVPGILALAAAIRELPPPEQANQAGKRIRDRLITGLQTRITSVIGPGVLQIIRPMPAVPQILTVSFRGYRGETLVHALAQRGVYVSAGSACAKGKQSHVLSAMGLSNEDIDGAIRVSTGLDTSEDDVVCFEDALCEILPSLAHRTPAAKQPCVSG